MGVVIRSGKSYEFRFFYFFLLVVCALAVLLVSGRPAKEVSEGPYYVEPKKLNKSIPSENSLQIGAFELDQCQELAIALLVDTSGSMNIPPEKNTGLKTALRTISQYLGRDSLLALYTFSGPDGTLQNPPREIIPFSKFGNVSSFYTSSVDQLTPRGSTYTRVAMMFVSPKILEAKQKYPQYKNFALLVFTDGVPYVYPPKASCNLADPQSCFSPEQDPTEPPDVVAEIKDNGIIVYTIAFNGDLDRSSSDKLEVMLKKMATSPDHYYSAQRAGDLSGIFEEIGQKLCSK